MDGWRHVHACTSCLHPSSEPPPPSPPNRCWLQHPRDRAHSREKVNLFLPTAEELVADHRKDLLEKVSAGVCVCGGGGRKVDRLVDGVGGWGGGGRKVDCLIGGGEGWLIV